MYSEIQNIIYWEGKRKTSHIKEEIFDVVNPVAQGNKDKREQSLYVLIPKKLRVKRSITTETGFAIIEASNGDIILRKQGA